MLTPQSFFRTSLGSTAKDSKSVGMRYSCGRPASVAAAVAAVMAAAVRAADVAAAVGEIGRFTRAAGCCGRWRMKSMWLGGFPLQPRVDAVAAAARAALLTSK